MSRPLNIDGFLREHYRERGGRWCAEQLGVGIYSVYHRAAAIGVKYKRLVVWPEKDKQLLAFMWADRSLEDIREALGGRYTLKQLYIQAGKQELGWGCPKGFEYLTEASRRTGMDTPQLRRVLKWAGVVVRKAKARPDSVPRPAAERQRYKTNHTHWVVDPHDVDEALERWLQTEQATHAAERYGVSMDCLLRAIERLGLNKDLPKRTKGSYWRLPLEVADAAGQAARASSEEWHRRRTARAGVDSGRRSEEQKQARLARRRAS